jgi:predicted nuclease of restriction endonuclease-like (RecB) superfamily
MTTSRKIAAIVHQPAAQLYDRFVAGIKQRIRTAQIKAALAANAELVLHYWEIGGDILASQKREGWGAKVIDRLATDLQREFPKLAGYSARNLKYMRAFAEAWPDRAIVHQLGAQIPWKHNCVLLDRVKDPVIREFYIRKTLEHGWSRSVLVHQLDTELHRRIGKAPTNFALTLPSPQSDLAREMIKDPFIFKPAPLDESARERALEKALLARLKDFLIELGAGFAFVGNQYRLEVDGEEFFLDLLFYHTRLHCYVVVDLKVVDFQPEFIGKMNFYQTAVDKL